MYNPLVPFNTLTGKTVTLIYQGEYNGSTALFFEMDDGDKFVMYHQQDCCENVNLEEIIGDLDDLIGSPILEAEDSSNSEEGKYGDSETWTFYKLSTIKGSVTLRWYGTSNGYYSESVDLYKLTRKE